MEKIRNAPTTIYVHSVKFSMTLLLSFVKSVVVTSLQKLSQNN